MKCRGSMEVVLSEPSVIEGMGKALERTDHGQTVSISQWVGVAELEWDYSDAPERKYRIEDKHRQLRISRSC